MAESKHFKDDELKCKGESCCGKRNGCTQELVNGLETIRYMGGDKPVIISSAYRCPKHNNRIGSKHTSYHVKGLAIDVVKIGGYNANNGEDAKCIQNIMNKCGFWTYIGEGFVHGDLRDRTKR